MDSPSKTPFRAIGAPATPKITMISPPTHPDLEANLRTASQRSFSSFKFEQECQRLAAQPNMVCDLTSDTDTTEDSNDASDDEAIETLYEAQKRWGENEGYDGEVPFPTEENFPPPPYVPQLEVASDGTLIDVDHRLDELNATMLAAEAALSNAKRKYGYNPFWT